MTQAITGKHVTRDGRSIRTVIPVTAIRQVTECQSEKDALKVQFCDEDAAVPKWITLFDVKVQRFDLAITDLDMNLE